MTEKIPDFGLSAYFKEMFPIENWDDYKHDVDSVTCIKSDEYLLCTTHFVQMIDEILADARNPQEVVENLTKLRADRYAFLVNGMKRPE